MTIGNTNIYNIFLVWFTKNIGHVTCTAICSRRILDAIFKCENWTYVIGIGNVNWFIFLFKKQQSLQ